MAWADDMADLDRTVFDLLSDDAAATWTRGGALGFAVPVAVILDRVERPATRHGLAVIDMADVARLSAAEVEARRPGARPEGGDTLTVDGSVFVVRGDAWRDEASDGRDWLCAISG